MNITEGATLELKREYSEEIKKTVVAFANTAGGVIYLGVNDDGTVRGIEKVDDELLRVSNAVRNSIKPDVTMFVSYIVEDIEDKAVIKITVQKGSSRPYYLTEKGLRPAGVYVRQGSSCMPASESAIFKMIKETGGDPTRNCALFSRSSLFHLLPGNLPRVIFHSANMTEKGLNWLIPTVCIPI